MRAPLVVIACLLTLSSDRVVGQCADFAGEARKLVGPLVEEAPDDALPQYATSTVEVRVDRCPQFSTIEIWGPTRSRRSITFLLWVGVHGQPFSIAWKSKPGDIVRTLFPGQSPERVRSRMFNVLQRRLGFGRCGTVDVKEKARGKVSVLSCETANGVGRVELVEDIATGVVMTATVADPGVE